MVDQVTDFADEMLPTDITDFVGRFFDLGRLFNHFEANRFHASCEQLTGVRLSARILGSIRDRLFKFVERSHDKVREHLPSRQTV